MVFVMGEAKAFAGEVASKNTHACVQVFSKFWKFEMELQRRPEALAGFLFGFGADQETQLVAVAGEEPRSKITTEIAGRAGYEDRHKGSEGVAALESGAPCAGSPVQSSARGSRDSSGRPSISG